MKTRQNPVEIGPASLTLTKSADEAIALAPAKSARSGFPPVAFARAGSGPGNSSLRRSSVLSVAFG